MFMGWNRQVLRKLETIKNTDKSEYIKIKTLYVEGWAEEHHKVKRQVINRENIVVTSMTKDW